MNLNQVTLPAIDLNESTAFYLKLGFTQIVKSDHYARFLCTEGNSTFSIHLSSKKNDSDFIVYFECDDVDAEYNRLKEKGIEFKSEPKDEKWLWREARIFDPSDNEICLYSAGVNRINPPWRVNISL
ncbi:MAG: VOC family protein [Melioribacteraceae bacterium]|nr:VOC family protein [Melioribacteraceae bacterium]